MITQINKKPACRQAGITQIIFIALITCAVGAQAAEKPKDVNQIFYQANACYEKGEYAKAIEQYVSILDMGLENGHIYYNIGNAFLKMGKTGYAILCYEKARRFIPADSDLKANLNYAVSLTEGEGFQSPGKKLITKAIEKPFRALNLNALFVSLAVFYIIFIAIASISIIGPIFARRAKFLFFITLAAFLLNLACFGLRYYDEEILKRGVVIQKEAECKYEPIDKATTYYKLHEGNEVLIFETRNGWRRIKRLDGKIGWIKKEVVEEI